MSLLSKREYLARIHARYQRVGREFKSRILDEFCHHCGYHRKAALRLLGKPGGKSFKERKGRPGPKARYDAGRLRPVLKVFWLASDQLCSKLLKAALPQWVGHYESLQGRLSAKLREQLLAMSAATMDRLLSPLRVRHPRRGLSTTKPGSLLRHRIPSRGGPPDTSTPGHVEADTVAHCGDTTAGDFVYSLTFTDLFSGWTENRAVWNKGTQGILKQLKDIEAKAPFALQSFHADNGSEFLNWALYEHLAERTRKVPFTRSRAYRKNDNAHCEQKNYTFVRQLFGHERFEHQELVELMNELYAGAWNQYQNHFRPTFKLKRRDKRGSKTVRRYEVLKTPYERLLESAQISAATKQRLRIEHARLNPFILKKEIEMKLRKFFTHLGNLDCESTKA